MVIFGVGQCSWSRLSAGFASGYEPTASEPWIYEGHNSQAHPPIFSPHLPLIRVDRLLSTVLLVECSEKAVRVDAKIGEVASSLQIRTTVQALASEFSGGISFIFLIAYHSQAEETPFTTVVPILRCKIDIVKLISFPRICRQDLHRYLFQSPVSLV